MIKFNIGFMSILTLIFITLKLMGIINWSWWWVLSPALFSFGLVILAIFLVGFVMMCILGVIGNYSVKFDKLKGRSKWK